MEEIAAYLSKSKESLASAKDNLKSKRYNSCANRAYYACYQAAIAALLKHGISPVGGKGLLKHDFVQSQFGALIKRKKIYPSKIRAHLPNLMDTRITADYKAAAVSKKEAGRVLQKAKRFVSIVSEETI